MRVRGTTGVFSLIGMLVLFGARGGWAQAPSPADMATPEEEGVDLADEDDRDARALRMFRRGMALLEDRQDERALRVLEGVLFNFPESPERHRAALALGKYRVENNENDLALKVLNTVIDAEDAEDAFRAEALYRIGVAYYGLSNFTQALTALRRVTTEYPWSVFANEGYYYIGLCHFRLERWFQAVEALKMVGTSVPPAGEDRPVLVEAGQRFFVKVHDKDLKVRMLREETIDAAATSSSGDREKVTLSPFDAEGEYYLGSIVVEPGEAVPEDGILQVRGRDVIDVAYVDAQTQAGEKDRPRNVRAQTVSTAVGGFVDGAFREYVEGVFSGQRTFLRIRDLDESSAESPASVTVRLYSRYEKPPEEVDPALLETGEKQYAVRDETHVTLTEHEAGSGDFRATIVIAPERDENTDLRAEDGDDVFMEYVDRRHIDGLDAPRTVRSQAQFLTGQLPDVVIAHREVSDIQLRARKNLLEARFYLRLAEIFARVGLQDRAGRQAAAGLERVQDILRHSLDANIDRETIENAYQVQWELHLVRKDLRQAIASCRRLMELFPTSSLADKALLQIARANLESGNNAAALQILAGLIDMPVADEIKAEALFLRASILEKQVPENVSEERKLAAMGPAIQAYMRVADQFGQSAFAGEALGKVVDFHINCGNYERADSLLHTIFQDYPDAPFLDDMLLKWGLALYRMQRIDAAIEKFNRLLRDYPGSDVAGQAKQVLEVLQRRR